MLAAIKVDDDHRNFAGDDSEFLAYGIRTYIETTLLQEQAHQVVFRLLHPTEGFDLRTSDLSGFMAQLCNMNLGKSITLQAIDFDWSDLPEDFIPCLQYWESCGVHFTRETDAVEPSTSHLAGILQMADGSFCGIALDSPQAEELSDHWQFESSSPEVAPTQAYIGRIHGIPTAKVCQAPAIKTTITIVEEAPNAAVMVPNLDFTLMTFRNFGERLLLAAAQAHGETSFVDLLEKKVKDCTLTNATYSDRYLLRAMDPVLVLSIFRALRDVAGAESATFVMKTRSSNQFGRDPYKLRNYWRDDVSREQTLSTLASQVKQGKSGWAPTSVRFDIEEELPHERQLTLEFRSGEKYVLQLDRGVGFIEANGIIPTAVRNNQQNPYEVNLAQYLLRLTTSTKTREEELVFCSEHTSIYSRFEK